MLASELSGLKNWLVIDFFCLLCFYKPPYKSLHRRPVALEHYYAVPYAIFSRLWPYSPNSQHNLNWNFSPQIQFGKTLNAILLNPKNVNFVNPKTTFCHIKVLNINLMGILPLN